MADIVNPGATSGMLNADAMPQNQDLVIYKGDYVELFVTVKDAAGVPLDLTGSTPKAQLKLDYDDASPVNFTCSLTGVTGQVRVYLSSATAATLKPGAYIWDFQVTNSSSQTRTYLAGDVTVYNEVTT
jgi:hypothetical protein